MANDQVNLDALKTELDELGFVVVRDAIPRDQASRMAERLMEIMRRQPDADKLYQNLRGVFNYDDEDTFVPLVTHPAVLQLARHTVGEGMQMAEVGALWNKPGASAGRLHADVPIGWFARAGRPIPEVCFMVNCIWMLTEFTSENGGTVFLPCSHLSRRVPRTDVSYPYLVPVAGSPGSVVIFNGSIWHGSGPNRTASSERLGVSAGYFAHWMDPRAGGWYLLTREVRDRMPPEVREMNRHVVERPGQKIGDGDY